MERSTVEILIVLVLLCLISLVFVGTYHLFRGDQEPRRTKVVPQVLPRVHDVVPFDVPMWIPWSAGWIGGYNGIVDRPMPHYYPGPRPSRYARERNEPEPYNTNKIFP